ncbi:MAG TPA: carboxypeptidase-like regulatory domain-containing protein [Thermoanaerobaculia bacterium]|nr:carboxypeptidase-like regulatory domain-containing protein [Thermoanaerobaculia bacterium]
MHVLLMLLALLAPDPASPGGAIEATIRGTKQPLAVELLLRQDDDSWNKIAQRNITAEPRHVRFAGLVSGVYQVRVRGAESGEQFAMKIGIGDGDERRTTIAIAPHELTGRITLGGASLGAAALILRHKEFRWEQVVPVREDGTFHAPLWQYGQFIYSVRTPSLPTPYSAHVELGEEPFVIDIPDGRITGIVRDGKSGTPMAGVSVALQTNAGPSEHHVRTATDAQGRFDFVGMKYGRHTVRADTPLYLQPAPAVFELDERSPLRELDLRLDPGRTVPLLVVDAGEDPVDEAMVYAIAGAKLCARAITDEDGGTAIAIPDNEAAFLFVIAQDGGFGAAHVGREHGGERVRVDLPPASSSLLIRAHTTDGAEMPPFALLMRYNGVLVPVDVLEELTAVQGLRFATGAKAEVRLERIPGGSYEFWPYRTETEAEAIVASADDVAAPIRLDVRAGKNTVAVKFAAR